MNRLAYPKGAQRRPVFGPAVVLWLFLVSLWPAPAAARNPARAPDIELRGTITRADHQRYLRAPFTMPDGVDRLVVAFEYDQRDQKTVIDLGIVDPQGFRGASGGNKPSFTIARADATPSYLPGPLIPGQWALALAVPNIRKSVTANWTARIWLLRGAEAQALPSPTEGRGPGWYRGDLHLHSGHSDGSCTNMREIRVPCPLYRTLDAARARSLDFVALTEHNTMSQAATLRELAPFHDSMLLIPGREMTTFHGHFNIFGITSEVDFSLAEGIDNSFGKIADRVHALGGIVSVNHPRLPSGEICMGCGWTMPGFDWSKIDAVEAINGGSPFGIEGPLAGTPFWLDGLRAGHAVAAIGASDNHDPAKTGFGAVGVPATVVFARDLSQAAILDGIRKGRAFIDLTGEGSVHLDYIVRAGRIQAPMGGQLRGGGVLSLSAEARGPAGTILEIVDGTELLVRQPLAEGAARTVTLAARPGRRIIRAQLRGADGALLALGNAVLIEP